MQNLLRVEEDFMTQKGRVELKSQLIVEDTLIWLSKNGSNNWSGYFSVPANSSTEQWIEIHNNKREFCTLTLEDGGVGEILITPELLPPKIHFRVTGNLKLKTEETSTNE